MRSRPLTSTGAPLLRRSCASAKRVSSEVATCRAPPRRNSTHEARVLLTGRVTAVERQVRRASTHVT